MAYTILRRIRLSTTTRSRLFSRFSPGRFTLRRISPRPMFAWIVQRKPAGIPPTSIPILSQFHAMIPFTTHHQNAANLEDHHQDDSKEETFWELRFTCDYEYIEGKYYLRSMTLHGLWRNKMVKGKMIADNNVGDYMKNMPQAQQV